MTITTMIIKAQNTRPVESSEPPIDLSDLFLSLKGVLFPPQVHGGCQDLLNDQVMGLRVPAVYWLGDAGLGQKFLGCRSCKHPPTQRHPSELSHLCPLQVTTRSIPLSLR